MSNKDGSYNRGEHVRKDPNFERTRENMSEFGRACKANRLLRNAYRVTLRSMADRYVSARLTKAMVKLVHSDLINGRGKRMAGKGELTILEGFNFNRETSLQHILHTSYTVTMNRATGIGAINIPVFIANAMLQTAASDVSDFRMIGIAAAIDFEDTTAGWFEPSTTDILNLHNNTRESIHLPLTIPAGNPYPVIVSLGIQFYRYDAGQFSMVEKKYNAMAIVKTFKAPDELPPVTGGAY